MADYVLIRDQDDHQHSDTKDSVFLLETRLGFLKKVYGILSAQLALTVFVCTLIMSSQALQKTFCNTAVLIIALVVQIGVMIPLLCSKKLARTVPKNYILLGIFTLCEAILVGVICSFYEPLSVFMAAIMTLGITLVLTVYAFTSKVGFKELFAVLLVCIFAMLFTGIFGLMFGMGKSYGTLYCGLGVVVFGIYIIIDTKLLADGKYGISHEDYVFGALILYLDIIQLFFYILRLFGRRN